MAGKRKKHEGSSDHPELHAFASDFPQVSEKMLALLLLAVEKQDHMKFASLFALLCEMHGYGVNPSSVQEYLEESLPFTMSLQEFDTHYLWVLLDGAIDDGSK